MPSPPKPCLKFSLVVGMFISVSILCFVFLFIFSQTRSRSKHFSGTVPSVIQQNISKKENPDPKNESRLDQGLASQNKSHAEAQTPSDNLKAPQTSPSIAKNYNPNFEDILAFEAWVMDYLNENCDLNEQSGECMDHDPRKHHNLVTRGEKLARNYSLYWTINNQSAGVSRENKNFIFDNLDSFPSRVKEALQITQSSHDSFSALTENLQNVAFENVPENIDSINLFTNSHNRQRRSGSNLDLNKSPSGIPPEVRKVLVIPARFLEETTQFEPIISDIGSNMLLTNEWSETIVEELQKDTYEPISREKLEEKMQEVRNYLYYNTEQRLDLVPVIAPTVTMMIPRFEPSLGEDSSEVNPYDSTGNIGPMKDKIEYDPLLNLDPLEADLGLDHYIYDVINQDWAPWSQRFNGIRSIQTAGFDISSVIGQDDAWPPVVEIKNGSSHGLFKEAKATLDINESGFVTQIYITDPGEYYDITSIGNIKVFINGQDFTSNCSIDVGSTLHSVLFMSNYSEGENLNDPKLLPEVSGGHIKISGGEVASVDILKILLFNQGANKAHTFSSFGEQVLSDEAIQVEKNNHLTAMGSASDLTSGSELTIIEKLNIGLIRQQAVLGALALPYDISGMGYDLDTDIADISEVSLPTHPLKELNSTVSNTFRIYRSNYNQPPRPLREENFRVTLTEEINATLPNANNVNDQRFIEVVFTGSGEDVQADFNWSSGFIWDLNITGGGRGFVEEPRVEIHIFDQNLTSQETITLSPSTITIPKGAHHQSLAQLLDDNFANHALRGLRVYSNALGLARPLVIEKISEGTPPLQEYYVSFRTDFSSSGLALYAATEINLICSENFLLDATPQTPQNFEDAALLIGRTFSDYDLGIHITPIRKGGVEPMTYIEAVVNIGDTNLSKAPEIELYVNNDTPEVNEDVEIGAHIIDGNTSHYAYSWYLNELPLDDIKFLNQPSAVLRFTEPGSHVVRVVVSDLRGGLTSRNILISVKGSENTNSSTLSGTISSRKGEIQGARAVLAKAPLIEHNVSLSGDLQYSWFPDGIHQNAQFMIDGKVAPQLQFRRGEIHRFYFDQSTEYLPMTFLKKPENSPPQVQINMLAFPSAKSPRGAQYLQNPDIYYTIRSAFSSYTTQKTGTYLEMLEYLLERNGTVSSVDESNGTILKLLNYKRDENITLFDSENLITRPYAKALMQESNVTTPRVGPTLIDELGYRMYGGRGYDRNNVPQVEVKRASIWEDYSKTDANVTAYVDGVGTISPVNADSFLGQNWITRPDDSVFPEILIWGSGGGDDDDPYDETNATVTGWIDASKPPNYMRTIKVHNQGKRYEPNATMAVLHYPINPKGYWTFDRHETLFEDKTQARYQPSPSWNREHDFETLEHHWTFDDNQTNTIMDSKGNSPLIYSSPTLPDNFSWGILGKAITLPVGESFSVTGVLDDNFTFSIWAKPTGTWNINIGGATLSFTDPAYTFGPSILNYSINNYWTHLAVVSEENSTTFYVDGRSGDGDTIVNQDLIINSAGGSVILDEAKLYHKAMDVNEVLYLAGRSILDISGNKFHAVPVGTGAIMTAPSSQISSSDVPSDTIFAGSPNGSGRLGDSYLNENNGHSVSLNGTDQYIDLLAHASEFPLTEGTISLWVYANSFPTQAPLFTLATPYVGALPDVNATSYEISEMGNLFALELTNGWPRLGGSRAYLASDRLKLGQWHHLVATFGASSNIWVDAIQTTPTQISLTQEQRFLEAENFIELSTSAKMFALGKGYSRNDDPLGPSPSTIYFDGKLDDLAIYDRVLGNDEINYLYELRRGREQVPRLETRVDAVGTVEINDAGQGYRENPDLVFWFGAQAKYEANLTTFPNLNAMESNFTDGGGDYNGSIGQLTFVDSNDSEEGVYSFYVGNDRDGSFNWRSGQVSGWRRHISATGLVEFENASLGDVVWTKRMDFPVQLPMPDGRLVKKRFVDYVTLDKNLSIPLDMNSSLTELHSYYQPNGLYGFVEAVNLTVSSPEKDNPSASAQNTAEAYILYHIDQDANESVSIIDPGHGILDLNTTQVRVSGPGYSNIGMETFDPGLEILGISGRKMPTGNNPNDVNVASIELNKSYSKVFLNDPGFGYSMPVELKVVGGLPRYVHPDNSPLNANATIPLPELNSSEAFQFREANLTITLGDIHEHNGTIKSVTIVDGGGGYVPYHEKVDSTLNKTRDMVWRDVEAEIYPLISVSGGGGTGAQLMAVLSPDGNITDVQVVNGGSGYFNIDRDNKPKVILAHSASSVLGEKNATMEVRLGGYLEGISPCISCTEGIHTIRTPLQKPDDWFSHLEPWIEIWDRGRSEDFIDASGSRATATAKVVNGQINKVVVTKSGHGYIDPVVYVRDAGPKYFDYFDSETETFKRKWRCAYKRINELGVEEECGHIHHGLYPPESCPGEVDEQLPYLDDNENPYIATGIELTNWRTRHLELHPDCNATTHLSGNFLSRKCWGTKTNFILDDPIYRKGWTHLDANLSVISKSGMIQEIIVNSAGANYHASELHVEGTGTGVDAIPVFDEYGLNTEVIFNDPKLKNLELDRIDRFDGAGQGFTERPWSWDSNSSPVHTGLAETLKVITRPSRQGIDWSFGGAELADAWGDRISYVRIYDDGIYSNSTTDAALSQITIDFNSSVTRDHDGDGISDFSQAQVAGHVTHKLTSLLFDSNATDDENVGIFTEKPQVNLVDGRHFFDLNPKPHFVYDEENKSEYILLNDDVDYDPVRNRSYIDLYVDDRFPEQLYYGILDNNAAQLGEILPAFGGEILVSEGMPGLNWAVDEPKKKPHYSYSDQFGKFIFSNLEPGMYNLAVFMEDKHLQESTFRPESNQSRISQVLYIPGIPELTLETDGAGIGKSKLIWSPHSRMLSRHPGRKTAEEEFNLEYGDKKLAGIGKGFEHGKVPELKFLPASTNFGKARPNVSVSVNLDGSLNLEIVDDENTSSYYPQDRFRVVYSSEVVGVDFFESYLFSESNNTFGSGVMASWDYNLTAGMHTSSPRILLSPDDANGTNAVEAWLSTQSYGDTPLSLKATVLEKNGSINTHAIVDWKIHFDFNASDSNNSRIAQLEDASGNRDVNATGSQVDLFLYSTLKGRYGAVKEVKIIFGGTGYSLGDTIQLDGDVYGFEANITQINSGVIEKIEVHANGNGANEFTNTKIMDENGTNPSAGEGAILELILYPGELFVEANTTIGGIAKSETIRIRPSSRNILSAKELWLDRYLDSFMEQGPTWWIADSDNDNAINQEEFEWSTNPLHHDTDLDDLNDSNEYGKSNPFSQDTDGDGLSDLNESLAGTNPYLRDTDRDGVSDLREYILGLNATRADGGEGEISAIISKGKHAYPNAFYLKFFTTNQSQPAAFDASSSTDGADLNSSYYPSFFLKDGLALDRNYSLGAFIDLDGDLIFSDGEPYAEWNDTLTESTYGIPMTLSEDVPELNFTSLAYHQIDINDSDTTPWDQWGVEAYDPGRGVRGYPQRWKVDESDPILGYQILLSGSFMEFLTGIGAAIPASLVDLPNLRLGDYNITYQAVDEWGNLSNTLVQLIRVRDTIAPGLTLSASNGTYSYFKSAGSGAPLVGSSYENNTTWLWPGGQEIPYELNVFDEWDDAPLNQTTISYQSSPVNSINVNQLGDYNVSISSTDDSNNTTLLSVLVQIRDLEAPSIQFGQSGNESNASTIFLGEEADFPALSIMDDFNNTPYYSISFPIGLVVESNDTILSNGLAIYEANSSNLGTYKLFPLQDGNFSIEINATDGANHQIKAYQLEVLKPALEKTIIVFDGYLSGSSVEIYTPLGKSLIKTLETNGTGQSILRLDNGSVEFISAMSDSRDMFGTIEVSAGMDTVTNSPFLGKIIGRLPFLIESNKTVVSPLTTLLMEFLEQGLTAEQASAQASSAFNLQSGLDLFSFDPYEPSVSFEASRPKVLAATLRLANLMNQTEALFNGMGSVHSAGDIGAALVRQLADQMLHSGLSLHSQSLSRDELEIYIQSAADNAGISMPALLTASNLSDGSEIIQACDDAYFRLINGAATSNDAAQLQINELTALSQLIDQVATQELQTGTFASLESLALQVVTSMSTVRYRKSINLYAPEANSFESFLRREQWQPEYLIHKISPLDGDGDWINTLMLSGNFDRNRDGRSAFRLSTSGSLSIYDPQDIQAIAGQTIRLEIRLDDGRGKHSTIEGVISVEENTPMGSKQLGHSWFESLWFGTFFLSNESWIYHLSLDWLYYKSDSLGGYWLWDDAWSTWWWTSQEHFPWIYRDDTKSWVYIYNDAGKVMLYDQESLKWRRRK